MRLGRHWKIGLTFGFEIDLDDKSTNQFSEGNDP